MNERPKFFLLFLDGLKLDYKAGGLKRIVPFLFGGFIGIGFLIVHYIPATITTTPKEIFPIIAALITAQGIILAMSMQTSGVILNNISVGNFSLFLKSKGLLEYYMLLVQFIQIIHITSLSALLATAIISLLGIPLFFKIMLAVSMGLFIYALRWAAGTSVIVRDLIHYRSEFQYDEEIKKSFKNEKEIY